MSEADPSDDLRFMTLALALGRRGLGRTWPNPAVGAVVVKHGKIVGRGWTQPGGRPHAEIEALRRAGAMARGGTLYVTPEPCSHHCKSEPCSTPSFACRSGRACLRLRAIRRSGLLLAKTRPPRPKKPRGPTGRKWFGRSKRMDGSISTRS